MLNIGQKHTTKSLILIVVFFACHLLAMSQNEIKSRILKVGVYDNPPKIFINKAGEPDGIFIDIINSISRSEDLQVEFIEGSWSALYAMLENQEIDILPDMAYSDSRDSLFNFSMPVLGSWLEVFTIKGSEINKIADLNNRRIGVLRASSQEDYLKLNLKNNFNIDYHIHAYESYIKSVEALKEGEIDALVANRFFYFSELCDDEVVPSGIILQLSELHFAFSNSTDHRIIEMFDKNISLLKNDLQSDYYASLLKWFRKGKTAIPGYLKVLIALLISGLTIFLLFTFILNYKVNAKTRILNQQNSDLIIARQRAEESDRLKTIFLQNMSHEIRTPMNGIVGFAELLQEQELPEELQQNYLESIKVSGARMLSIIDDIVCISKIESGIIELNLQDIDVNDQLEYLFTYFKPETEAKDLNFSLKTPPLSSKTIIKTDPNKFQIIFKNLIKNAIKYTDNGSIEFGFDTKAGFAEFYVKDTGMGIETGRQAAIFERFIQADIDDKMAKQGAGLGLAIAKAYVEMLGGKIWVESSVGKGSVFYFAIPL
jgi:signal transduction histidine kinase